MLNPKSATHHAPRKTAVAQSFQIGSHSLLDLEQGDSDRKSSFLGNTHHQDDFVNAIKETQGDTISARIAGVTGSTAGSQGFIDAKLAVSKFLKIFPGQEEIGSLTETFQMMTGVQGDKFFHGTLSPQSLQNAIRMRGLEFSDAELALVFPILDIDGDGSVDLDEFTHFGMAATITAQRISSGIGAKPGTGVYDEAKVAVEKVLRLIPQHVLTYYSGKGELNELKKWLEEIDADGDGSIDPDELRIAMARFDVDMSEAEVNMIFPILDLDGDGNFDLEELTIFVKTATRTNALQQRITEGSGSKPGTPIFKSCKEAIFKLLSTVPGREELAELRTVFNLISPGGDGLINKEALQNTLHRYDCKFSDKESQLVFSVLDLDGDGGVDILEFTEFVKACSTTTQRIRAGCASEPGTARFTLAQVAVNKVLSIVPGGDQMSDLVDTFRKIDHDNSGQWSEVELMSAISLPDFKQRIGEAGLKPMTATEVGLVFQVLDEKNHGAIDLDTFVEFFKQARTLGMTLAFDPTTVTIDEPEQLSSTSKMRKSLKAVTNMTSAALFTVDAAKQEKELKLSKLLGRVHKNEKEVQMLCMSGLGLKDAHVQSLMFAMKNNTYVRSVHLQYNDITDAGATFIADFLEERQKSMGNQLNLCSINLASNQLSTVGINTIQSMAERCSLKQLRFRGNPGWNSDMLQDKHGEYSKDSL